MLRPLKNLKQIPIKRSDVQLLSDVVRYRFRNQVSNAIVCAIEGFNWLLGEESSVDREFLEAELALWKKDEQC